MPPSTLTRFAPSPTGHMHLGHAYAARIAWEEARQGQGRAVLRWEDIDSGRCAPEFETSILADLQWLGLHFGETAVRQRDRLEAYRSALDTLQAEGLLYPCFCTRKTIQEEIVRAGRAPHGSEGPVYPGICRQMDKGESDELRAAGQPHALRLKMDEACRRAGVLSWMDRASGMQLAQPEPFGDVVLARKDIPTSYHLAVTVDDAWQGITLVTRGADLFESTAVHRLLQALLGLPVPEWRHHRLICDEGGRRLAKRDRIHTLHSLRARGMSAAEVWDQLGLPAL